MSTPEVKNILLPHTLSQRRSDTATTPTDQNSIIPNDDDEGDNQWKDDMHVKYGNEKEDVQLAFTQNNNPTSFLIRPPFQSSTTTTHHHLSPSSSQQQQQQQPQLRKTGTTIVGCIVNNGNTLLLAADTRATDGTSGDIDALVKLTRFTFYLRGKIRDCIGNIHDEDEEEEEEEDGKEIDRNGHDLESENDISLPPARVSAISRFIQDKLYEGK
eukprot:11972802-Ditylum_brightwellii.AAC.1